MASTRPAGERVPVPRPPEPFVTTWRRLHRERDLTGAWTFTPSPSATAVLRTLAEHRDPVGGAELAHAAGVWQGNGTTRTLPKLETLGLVVSTDGTPARPGARVPRAWVLTELGRELVKLLQD